MFGVGVGVRVGGFTASGGGGFDPDAQAFFDRVTTAGGTLTTTEKNATNQLVLDMKAAGIWTAMKAVYPMVGSSAAACAQNLKSSSFTGTFTSGWTFASTGVTPNGTSAYMDSKLNLSSNLSISSGHFSFYSRTNAILNGWVMGAESSTGDRTQWVVRADGSGAYYGRYGSNSIATTNGTTSLGLSILNRPNLTNLKLHQNGSIANNATYTAAFLPNLNLYIGGNNNAGTFNAANNAQCAFASIGDGLTDTQASNFYTAVNSFQVSLSRNV
jgi:hypothetical protein